MTHPPLPDPWLLQLALALVRAPALMRWLPLVSGLARPCARALLARAVALSVRATPAPLPRP
jgi:hypothetical protein